MPRGCSHVGLSTLDLDATRAFYEDVLGFPAVRCDIIEFEEGGRIRHVFFDTGGGQLIAFMEPRGVPGFPPSTTPASTAASACPTRSTTSRSRSIRSRRSRPSARS